MQSLQEYLLENLETVEEGKIWNTIKNWFKSLFDSNSDKEYSRYNKGQKELTGARLSEYKNYLEENFDEDKIKIKKLTDSQLHKVVFPCGISPSEEYGFGFYDFIDYKKDKYYKESDYIGYMYSSAEISDTGALMQVKFNNTNIEIFKIQIVSEFENVLSIKDIIHMFTKEEELVKNFKYLVVKEKHNKDLFNQVINDCDFEKKFENSKSYAELKLNNE